MLASVQKLEGVCALSIVQLFAIGKEYDGDVELASNLVWVMAAVFLMALTYAGTRRGNVRLSLASAMLLALLLCFILLPVISISDDLLVTRQAALPLSSQSWRVATEDASVGLDLLLALAFYLLLACCLTGCRRKREDLWEVRPLAGRLARSQRLRPPPCLV
jgi:hypothetical protein